MILNVLAAVPHGGLMQTTPEALRGAGRPVPDVLPGPGERPYVISKDVVLPRERIPLWPLSDHFVIPRGWPFPGEFSPGDVLIAGGLAWLIAQSVVSRRMSPGTRPDEPLSGMHR
jgi:hypothetical protein